MKSITTVFIVLLGFFNFIGAQKVEGHITYKIDITSDDPEIEPMMAMMNGSIFNLYYSEFNTRTEMKMGSMMTTTTIVDLTNKKTLTLMSGIMGNNAIQGFVSDEDGEGDEDDVKIRLTSETKQIIGLKAKKAIVTLEDGQEFDFWYTDEVAVNLKDQAMIRKSGIPGMLLEMVINLDEFKMTFSAITFEKKLPKNNQLFSMEIPEGYTILPAEELMGIPGFGQ